MVCVYVKIVLLLLLLLRCPQGSIVYKKCARVREKNSATLTKHRASLPRFTVSAGRCWGETGTCMGEIVFRLLTFRFKSFIENVDVGIK